MPASVPITTTEMPEGSALAAFAAGADFRDSYAAPLHESDLSPVGLALRLMSSSPNWVSRLMDLRNALVRPFGIKDTGRLSARTDRPADAYKIGDQLGIFRIFDIGAREIVLGIDDRHLDVRVSVMTASGPARYIVTTTVTIHNLLGRLYMVPVGRIHPFVVRAQMRRARL
ncbi:DUF2867 domain-containing protein [Bradyrhizobium sp. WD16]|uniref:DUF2867 domain-containing protein n=1 Tax=Bradyrhizobium sp. WD16 TaxID=1521768 RepID=UPI0020A4AB89|nr:DUF2867 domain-containing protein [Bradyrhizobium sp. WD16]UTD29482.1 DUF2867 domain-containing protein [Bradyrhizobium sp. WD16]